MSKKLFLLDGMALVYRSYEEWINTCPRRILGFKTAEKRFIQEMAA